MPDEPQDANSVAVTTTRTTVVADSAAIGLKNLKVSKSQQSQWMQALAVEVIFGVMIWVAMRKDSPQNSFVFCIGLLLVFVAILGLWIVKDPLGILISNRNLMSMSRLQMTLWTVTVVPAFMVFVLYRARWDIPDAVAVNIPPELWAAMGISLASLVGTPLLLGSKTDQTPSMVALQTTAKSMATTDQGSVTTTALQDQSMGTLFANPIPDDARVSDMFQGDEVGNKASVDVAKVQMFVFTIVLVLVYASDVWRYLSGIDMKHLAQQGITGKAALDQIAARTSSLPIMSQSQIMLLLISHAGYLSSKAVNHTDQDK